MSNHGGRQLDGATSTIAALPRVVEAVQGRCEVLMDGGITCGQDVLKALALGARACLIGKAFLYGLAARGEAGVTLALDIIRRELEISMALSGVTTCARRRAREHWSKLPEAQSGERAALSRRRSAVRRPR